MKAYQYTVIATLENRRNKSLNRVLRLFSDRLLSKAEKKALSTKLKRRQEYLRRGFAKDYDVYIDVTKAKYPDAWYKNFSSVDHIFEVW